MTDPAAPTIRRLGLADGVRLVVGIRSGAGGRRPGPTDTDRPVVMLHGFTGDASTMDPLAAPLATGGPAAPAVAPGADSPADPARPDRSRHVDQPGRRVIAVNLIGHGGSTGPDLRSYSVDAMVDQVIEMLAMLDEREAIDLIGYSMGGRVALTLACRHPERVHTLSLIGVSAGLADANERRRRVTDDEALARSIEQDGLVAFVDRWMANPLFDTQLRLGPQRLAELRTQRLRNDGTELARSLRAAGTGRMRPLHDDLASCRVPTLLIVGEEDPKFSAIAAGLRDVLPDGRIAVIPEAGHAAHLENPRAVLAQLRTHLDTGPATHGVRLPLRSQLLTARGATRTRQSILYSLTVAGMTGWGDASPLPGWSNESLEDCRAALSTRFVVPSDEDAFDGAAAQRVLDGLTATAGSAGVPAARAAVAGAMLDLDARRHGRLLSAHLAARHGTESGRADTVEVHGVVSAPSPGGVADEVEAVVAAGVSTIKLKVAAGPVDVDVARAEAVRSAAPHVRLRLDANGGWDHDTALDALIRLAVFDVELCEEPVAGIEAIAEIGADGPITVAVDESARTVVDLERLWPLTASGHIGAVVIKPQAIGGPDLAMRAIADARSRGVQVIVTSMIDSAVGVAHAAHVAAAAGLPGAHGLDTSRLLTADVAPIADAVPIVAGRLSFAAADGGDGRRRFGDGLAIGPVSPWLVPSS